MTSKKHFQYSIQQREVHPITGEQLFSEQNILNGIAHKAIEKWSYILHVKDIDPHFHIALKCKNAVEIHTIAKWFGVPENFVHILHGANAYIKAVEYVTHDYNDSEVKSNHNWRKELDLYQTRRQRKE